MASASLRGPKWYLEISSCSRTLVTRISASLRPLHGHNKQFTSSTSRTSRFAYYRSYASSVRQSPAFRSLSTSTNPLQAQQTPAQSTPTTARNPTPAKEPVQDVNKGFSDQPLDLNEGDPNQVDWTRSFHGLSTERFPKETADILLATLDENDIEVKPDGFLYLPEIKYRRIMNQAFGPGGWGLAPRGESIVTAKAVTREYALVAQGRLVSIARGEMNYFSPEDIPTAAEGCKSNALMRCCKDLGIASELWDPRFIRAFKEKHTREVFVEHVVSKKRSKIWIRKGDSVSYPWKETKGFTPANGAGAKAS